MRFFLAVFTLTLTATAFAADTHHESLYARLGGEKAMHAVVDDFVGRLVADTHMNQWFGHMAKDAHEATEYKKHLADFLCKAAGGPCAYQGKDMPAAHHEHPVTADAFGLFAKHMEEALDHAKVHDAEKHELMTLVSGMKASVVGH